MRAETRTAGIPGSRGPVQGSCVTGTGTDGGKTGGTAAWRRARRGRGRGGEGGSGGGLGGLRGPGGEWVGRVGCAGGECAGRRLEGGASGVWGVTLAQARKK